MGRLYGIKIFGADGFKLPDEAEAAIEAAVLSEPSVDGSASVDHRIGRVRVHAGAEGAYADFLGACIPAPPGSNHLKIILDCANGATCRRGCSPTAWSAW